MVSSSGEIEFVSENVTNYLQYSQVSCSELCCSAVSWQQIIIQLSLLRLSVDELFVPALLAAAVGLLDAISSAAAKRHSLWCTLVICFLVKIMNRRLLCILLQKYIRSFTLWLSVAVNCSFIKER